MNQQVAIVSQKSFRPELKRLFPVFFVHVNTEEIEQDQRILGDDEVADIHRIHGTMCNAWPFRDLFPDVLLNFQFLTQRRNVGNSLNLINRRFRVFETVPIAQPR